MIMILIVRMMVKGCYVISDKLNYGVFTVVDYIIGDKSNTYLMLM